MAFWISTWHLLLKSYEMHKHMHFEDLELYFVFVCLYVCMCFLSKTLNFLGVLTTFIERAADGFLNTFLHCWKAGEKKRNSKWMYYTECEELVAVILAVRFRQPTVTLHVVFNTAGFTTLKIRFVVMTSSFKKHC